jgi:capsular polysaccharide biosynthesis protein
VAVAKWCSVQANEAHCKAYKVHNLPLERPVVAAFRNALVTPVGHIITPHLKFKPLGPCNFKEEAPISASPTHASEVVVATAYWGDTTYHALVENLPRLMVVWEDLLAQPHVMVAAGSSVAMANYLEFMGLSKDRILHGNILADTAYVPNPGGCGYSPGHRYVQAVRKRMHAALMLQTAELDAASSILVIQRTGSSRSVANHDELVHAISREFPNVHVDVFADSQLPDFARTVRLFYSAKVIIAPHGAGLSNLMLATRHAVVIEFVIAPPNACYLDLARELGNEYHAVYGHSRSESTPMHVNVQEVVLLAKQALNN